MTDLDLAAACPLTAHAALERAALLAPDVEAVVTAAERITYRDLAAEVVRVRAALTAAGIGRGDRVGLCLGNGPRWVALFVALGSVGAVTVPVNTRYSADEVRHTLAHARVGTLFVADRVLNVDFHAVLREIGIGADATPTCPALPALERVVVCGDAVPGWATPWPEFLARGTGEVPATGTPDDVLLVQYTSGTTARPKGVLLTHRSMCADGFFSGARLGLRPGDRFHSARPFFHVAGSTLSVLACLQHATTLVTMPRFEPAEALRLLEEERCTHFSGNDTIALLLLNHPDLAHRTLRLRGAWVAASPTVIRRVIDELGAAECVAGYGLSEASPNVAQSCWWEPDEVRASGAMLAEPGVEVRIRALDGSRDCGPGEPGSILVRGWNVMQGYLDDPAATAAAVDPDGWLATGDVGVLDASGRLHFTGRTKDIIRVGGENVAPADVEDVLHRHPGVRQAVVVGVPDERLMEVPFAFVVLTGPGPSEQELIDWARTRMAGFKVPRHLRIVDGFEGIGMTASSKVQKNRLAAHARTLLGHDGTGAAA
ncbi:AMP-binding protein [Streptomyces olivaceus]|uniref:AMP-binding protein n=1 Tax=Streptomyces olivaceus TaxID=47716 RepID=UPI001CCC599E|nr:AMP-binding protein [Streptomyces olivaceus]MBZ6198842.1 AMP-binding protein [Streptomyces olivaceus]MBZ6303409.1 AMP-binding protein [Streptomyces olivaceus]MBZ6320296.1 AMP-binding protein [Streptomyces olivaceus]